MIGLEMKSKKWEMLTNPACLLPQGGWKLLEGQAGGQEGRVGRAAARVHQWMAQTEVKGGGGAQEAQGETGTEMILPPKFHCFFVTV